LNRAAHRRVLIVEDNLDIRGTLELVLEAGGFAVAVAANGAEALDLLRATDTLPSVILLDLMMPVMDGYAFRAAQEKDPKLASIPVILLTADNHAEAKGLSLHAAGSLQKPVDLDVLLTEVGQHC
jgi:CheY-like chemotaxis protein